MKRRIFASLIVLCLLMSTSAFAATDYSVDEAGVASDLESKISAIEIVAEEREQLLDIQLKITTEIDEALKSLPEIEFDGLLLAEEKTVLLDLRNDLRAIKLSMSEPINIYEEHVVKSYEVTDEFGITRAYEYEIKGYGRSYAGKSVTVTSQWTYDILRNVTTEGGATVDAYKPSSYNLYYYEANGGHITNMSGELRFYVSEQYPSGGSFNRSFDLNGSFSWSQVSGGIGWANDYGIGHLCIFSLGTGGGFKFNGGVTFLWNGTTRDYLDIVHGFGSL